MTQRKGAPHNKVLSVVDAVGGGEWIGFRVNRNYKRLLTGLRGVSGSDKVIIQSYQANVEYNIEVTSFKDITNTWYYKVTSNGVEKLMKSHTKTNAASGGMKIIVGQCTDCVISDFEYTF